MGEKMSLQEAIEHAQHYTQLGGGRVVHIKREAWDTIIAHLTQPAQAVDVSLEELDQMAVDAAIARCGFQHPHIEHKFKIPDQRRIMALMFKDGFRAAMSMLTAALPNANGKEGCQV